MGWKSLAMASTCPNEAALQQGFAGRCVLSEAVSECSATDNCGSAAVGVSIFASCVSPGAAATPCDTEGSERQYAFESNLMSWLETTEHMSVNNFDNEYFHAIVEMGEEAVPFILERIKERPTQLVHALDLIYPGRVKYHGAVSLRKACEEWMRLLSAAHPQTGKR